MKINLKIFRHNFKQVSGLGPMYGRLEPVKKNDKDVIISYVSRLVSCNQHFQLML